MVFSTCTLDSEDIHVAVYRYTPLSYRLYKMGRV